MRKLLPMLFCGVAAVSFSALAADASSSSDNPTKNPNAQGRSVDTGGARPDSSSAQGTVPQTAPAAGSASTGSSTDATTGSSTSEKRKARRADRADRDANTGASRDEEARRKTREGETSGIGGGTTTTGSGATTTTPGSTGGPSSGGGN